MKVRKATLFFAIMATLCLAVTLIANAVDPKSITTLTALYGFVFCIYAIFIIEMVVLLITVRKNEKIES